jgi:hypothetical protein
VATWRRAGAEVENHLQISDATVAEFIVETAKEAGNVDSFKKVTRSALQTRRFAYHGAHVWRSEVIYSGLHLRQQARGVRAQHGPTPADLTGRAPSPGGGTSGVLNSRSEE